MSSDIGGLPGYPEGVRARTLISMDFENTVNSGTVFTDNGQAGLIWTGSSGSVVTQTAASTQVLNGVSSLVLTSTASDYLTASVAPGQYLPATADFDMSFQVRTGSVSGTYMLSVQDVTATGAGTQFILYAGPTLSFYGSDGTTRALWISANPIITATGYTIRLSRRNGLFGLFMDGTLKGTYYLAGAICQPTGRQFRIGKPEFTGANGCTGQYDTFRLVEYIGPGPAWVV